MDTAIVKGFILICMVGSVEPKDLMDSFRANRYWGPNDDEQPNLSTQTIPKSELPHSLRKTFRGGLGLA